MATAKHMTRVVLVGKVKTVEHKGTGTYGVARGTIDTGNGNIARFTIWDRLNGDNPHTKGKDFVSQYKEGSLVYITGQDNRQYNEEKDQYYEDVNVWDYRDASPEEQYRWVFVYVGVVQSIENGLLNLSFINYKDEETVFPIKLDKTVPSAIEIGSIVKVKGMIFSGFKADFFGEGEYVTERTEVSVETLNTAEEVAKENEESEDAPEGALWD